MNSAPPPVTILNSRRFVDAVVGKDDVKAALLALAQMMDDYKALLTQQNLQHLEYAFSPVLARATVTCRIGTLIYVNPNGTITPADRATNQLAQGVVVTQEGNLNCKWSPLAFLRLVITDANTTGSGVIYLSNAGNVQASRPTAGTIQTVGMQYGYDRQTDSTLSLVFPGFSTFVG